MLVQLCQSRILGLIINDNHDNQDGDGGGGDDHDDDHGDDDHCRGGADFQPWPHQSRILRLQCRGSDINIVYHSTHLTYSFS